ncbi:hypothetical protein ABGB18_15925 [Nonomuraea sp. B12E4]|uniref:hypothetical protein n=1 Tax=Nonomuraea sp. B12E4 TaxID=3153564 RepID=UPI00325D8E1E
MEPVEPVVRHPVAGGVVLLNVFALQNVSVPLYGFALLGVLALSRGPALSRVLALVDMPVLRGVPALRSVFALLGVLAQRGVGVLLGVLALLNVGVQPSVRALNVFVAMWPAACQHKHAPPISEVPGASPAKPDGAARQAGSVIGIPASPPTFG